MAAPIPDTASFAGTGMEAVCGRIWRKSKKGDKENDVQSSDREPATQGLRGGDADGPLPAGGTENGRYGMSSRLACARGPPYFVFPVSRLSVDLWQVV